MPKDLTDFGKGIDLAIDSLVSPQERREVIQRTAAELLEAARREIREAGGGRPKHTLSVDGQPARNLEGINPDHGTIAFQFEGSVVVEVVQAVLALLRENSPVLTGHYRASHRIYADRRDVTDEMPLPFDRAAEVKEFTVMPTVPYGRKVEKLHAVYEGVTALAQHRFDNAAGIYFEFRSPILPYVAGGANRAERQAIRGQPSRIAAMRAERQTRLPCISIMPAGR